MSERFLVCRLSSLGDVVCTLPAAAALKRFQPDCHITWAVDRRFRAVVDCCPDVDTVLEVQTKGLKYPRLENTFDAAFDMQGLFKSAALLRGLTCPRWGFHWQREGAGLFSSPVLPDPTSFHVVDQYVDVIRAFGAEVDRAEFHLAPPEDAKFAVETLLRERNVTRPYVVLNPGAGWVTKRWAPQSFARIVRFLDGLGYDSILTGGKDPAPTPADEVGAGISVAGQTTIPMLIALIQGAAAHVGGDTGTTHIAAALQTPLVGLYSITRPQRSGPYGCIDMCIYEPSNLNDISPDRVETLLRTILT